MSAPRHPGFRLVPPLACLLLLLGAGTLPSALLPVLDRAPGPGRRRCSTAGSRRGLARGGWLLLRALDMAVWRRRRPPVPRLLTQLVAARSGSPRP